GTVARAPVHHERRVLLRYRCRRPGRLVSQALRDLYGNLQPLRTEIRGGRGALRSYGRIAVARIHGVHRCRRGHGGELSQLRIRRESGKSYFATWTRAGPRPERQWISGVGTYARQEDHRRSRCVFGCFTATEDQDL